MDSSSEKSCGCDGKKSSILAITVRKLDLDRYSGLWYEVAKIPFIWEKDCDGATAEYQVKTGKNGQKYISVKNTCLRDDKPLRSRSAIAWINNPNDPGKLSLNFNDGLPSDGVGDYWLHATDYDTYSLVGGPTGKFLWILSRAEKMKRTQINRILNYAKELGYNIDIMKIWRNRIDLTD